MKMTDKDAIRLLSGESGSDVDGAFALAISALRERIERESPKPLTLDELREMGGEPVWITSPTGGTGVWRVCYGERARRRCGEKVIYFAVGICENISDYGKTWLAYRYNPKEAHT